MDFSKIKKISFILLILFILLFPFWCVRGLCAEELSFTEVNGIYVSATSNHFLSGDNTVGYILAEKGYSYTFSYSGSATRYIVSSSELPNVNIVYTILTSLSPESNTYTYIPNNNEYLYISTSTASGVSVTREKVPGQESAISDLVDNVGIGQIWDIFDISINYIVVVVLFAFGAYIIFRIIRKISRGKEGL